MKTVVFVLAQVVLVLPLVAREKNDGEKPLFIRQKWGAGDPLLLLLSANILWISMEYLPCFPRLYSYVVHAVPLYLPHLALLGIVYGIFRWKIKQPMSDLGFQQYRLVRFGFLALLVVLLCCEIGQRSGESGSLFFEAKNRISVFLLCPAVEEIICRGTLYSPYRRRFGPTKALLITSLLFAVFHMEVSIGIFVGYTLFGLAMGVLYEKTESLIWPILAHGIINIPGRII